MKAFMDKDFMLQSPTAQHLYHDYAADMPICDYHCHIPPREIYENRRFENIAQVWLGGRNPDGSYFGDHYKWRLMRAAGLPAFASCPTLPRSGLQRASPIRESLRERSAAASSAGRAFPTLRASPWRSRSSPR